MQDFFQTFWDILVQNKTRLIFIFLSSLVLHVLFRRFIEAITKFLFVAVRSFFFKDIKLFYDYRWQKSKQIFSNQHMTNSFSFPKERLFKHYYEKLELIHLHDKNNSTSYLEEALKNRRIKKVLHILLDLSYLKKDDKDHLLYKKRESTTGKIHEGCFDMNEMSYASFIYRYYFMHKGVTYKEIKSVKSLENAFKNLLTNYQLFILEKKTDYLFQLKFYALYFKWLWVVLTLNIKAFKMYFDNQLQRDIDKARAMHWFRPPYLSRLNYNENMAWWDRKKLRNWPYNKLIAGEGKWKLFRRDILDIEDWEKIKNDIELLKKDSTSLIYPLLEYNSNGEKIINFEKFTHKDLIHSFQTDNYEDSKVLDIGVITLKIHHEKIFYYSAKGVDLWQMTNKAVNSKNLNAFIYNGATVAKWYPNFKRYSAEFSFKYFEINDETINSFKELVLFVNNELALAQENEKFSFSEGIFKNTNFLIVRCDKPSQGFLIYKEYFNKLANASIIMFTIMKKSWFFNSSNRIFDTYLNSVGFLLFFIIAFVLEEIYSEPVISFIEKTTTFFSSLF